MGGYAGAQPIAALETPNGVTCHVKSFLQPAINDGRPVGGPGRPESGLPDFRTIVANSA